MKKISKTALALIVVLLACVDSRAQTISQITVTDTASNVTATAAGFYGVLYENSATPTAAFSVGVVNVAAGGAYTFSRAGGYPFQAGDVLGKVAATTSGPFNFVLVQYPTVPGHGALTPTKCPTNYAITEIKPDGTMTCTATTASGGVTSFNTRAGAVVPATNDYSEASLSFTDITTNDASTSKHGFMKKLPNDANTYYNGAGAFSTPPAGDTTATYLICSADATLTNAKIWPSLCKSPDLPPTSPNAMDDEFDGVSLDVKWVQNNVSGQTFTVGNGLLSIVGPATGVDSVRAIEQSTPSTPWTFTAKCTTAMGTSSGTFFGGLTARESSSGKIYSWSIGNQGGNLLTFYRWNGGASAAFTNTSIGISMTVYLRLQDDGTNMVASHSVDGLNFVQDSSTTVVSTFTTAPNKIGLFIDNNAAGVTSCDYFRRTQ